MKSILVLLLILAVSVNCFQIQADDKVLVELYTESLCPDCHVFIQGSLKKYLNTADIYLISDFKFYPYGNARWAKNGSSYTFTCQHGARECEGNLIETCAIRLYDNQKYANPFILCLDANTTNWAAQGQKCATQYGMNWTSISTCAYGAQGNAWEYEMAVATDKLVPAHQYTPWITVNGAHNTAYENSILSNMVSFVCKNYKGTVKIAACP